ncbi:hypothetical protein HDV05_008005 [Chytridiales sp. JEL 0842]|nr:hypothetical protein HDV05_008005 [Chytridiales sp. JEL 0842]
MHHQSLAEAQEKEERLRRAELNEKQKSVSDTDMVDRFSKIGSNIVDGKSSSSSSSSSPGSNQKRKREANEKDGGTTEKQVSKAGGEEHVNMSVKASRFKFLKPDV